jgi:hypothetical protein
MESPQNLSGHLCPLYFMKPCDLRIGSVWTESCELQMFGNDVPAYIMEKDSRDNDLLVAFCLFQEFYGILKRDLSMDEVLSGPQERSRPLKNFLINRLHRSTFEFSTLNPVTPFIFFLEDDDFDG